MPILRENTVFGIVIHFFVSRNVVVRSTHNAPMQMDVDAGSARVNPASGRRRGNARLPGWINC